MKDQAVEFNSILPLTLLQATYETTRAEFLYVAERAVQHIQHGSGCHWFVDGYTSDTLYLRLSYADSNLDLPSLNEELSLHVGSGTVTIRVMSRLPSVDDLFSQFVEHLNLSLPRRGA